jgi:hypothetical protein
MRTITIPVICLAIALAGCPTGKPAGAPEDASAPSAESAKPIALPVENPPDASTRPIETWIPGLGDAKEEKRERAVQVLTERRDIDFEFLLKTWDGADPGPLRDGLARVLQIRPLLDADAVVVGEGIGYYPKSHMTGIEGECLVCAQGRLALRVDEVLKGAEFVDEAFKVFSMIRRLPGHASHELPDLFNLTKGKPFLLLRAPETASISALKELDASFRGKKGMWIITGVPGRKTTADIRNEGKLRPEIILTWLCAFEEVPPDAGKRIRATLALIGR